MKNWQLEVNGYGQWRVIDADMPECYADVKYFRSRKKAEWWLQKQREHEAKSTFRPVGEES